MAWACARRRIRSRGCRQKSGRAPFTGAAYFAALDRLGARAPVVVFPNGGESSYFHERAAGDLGRYVLDEVITQAIRRTGADPRRIAIGGISMGGFGAYDNARLRLRAFCAVGGHSAALWLSGGASAAGGFQRMSWRIDLGRNPPRRGVDVHGRGRDRAPDRSLRGALAALLHRRRAGAPPRIDGRIYPALVHASTAIGLAESVWRSFTRPWRSAGRDRRATVRTLVVPFCG